MMDDWLMEGERDKFAILSFITQDFLRSSSSGRHPSKSLSSCGGEIPELDFSSHLIIWA